MIGSQEHVIVSDELDLLWFDKKVSSKHILLP